MIEENRCSIIIRGADVNSNEFKSFEKAFSVYNPVTHKYEYNIYTELNGNIYAPATITSSIVQTYFPSFTIVKNFANTPKADTINFSMAHTPRTDIQETALSFLKTIRNDKDNKNRMLNLATGSGKTFVSIALISYLKQKAMIVVDSIDLAAQWKHEILYHTDLTDDDILIMSGIEAVDLAKSNKNYKIFIAIHKTLNMILSVDANGINDLIHKLKIGVRIFDECHTNFKSICVINSLSNVNYTIFLTATPNRSDYKEDILFSKVFKHVPSYDGNKIDNEKYHTVVLISFDSHPTSKQKASVKTKYGFSLIKWANFLSENRLYENYIYSLNKIITSFGLIDKNKKVAIMLPTIELINKTYDSLHAIYPQLEIGKFIGEIKKDKRSEELSKIFILTNQKIFGKGIDVPDLDCIINYVQLSSKVNLEQIIGRLRNNSKHDHVFIDVTDNGYYQCRNQLKSRKRFYKKIAKKIIEITEITKKEGNQ